MYYTGLSAFYGNRVSDEENHEILKMVCGNCERCSGWHTQLYT